MPVAIVARPERQEGADEVQRRDIATATRGDIARVETEVAIALRCRGSRW
jgi:hypothetical protein